jgi:hypothetical protein
MTRRAERLEIARAAIPWVVVKMGNGQGETTAFKNPRRTELIVVNLFIGVRPPLHTTLQVSDRLSRLATWAVAVLASPTGFALDF